MCRNGDNELKMKVHEYQGKQIFQKYGIPTPKGIPAFSIEDALKAYDKLESETVVVKAQIHRHDTCYTPDWT